MGVPCEILLGTYLSEVLKKTGDLEVSVIRFIKISLMETREILSGSHRSLDRLVCLCRAVILCLLTFKLT